MRKLMMPFMAIALAFAMTVMAADRAEARRYHRGAVALGIAAAVIGGIALHRAHRRYKRRHYYYSGYYGDPYYYGYYPRRRHYYYGGYGYPRYYGGGWGRRHGYIHGWRGW